MADQPSAIGRPVAVFCDFDGTIIMDERFVTMMRAFAPEASERIIPQMIDGTTTLRDGIPAILETIDSTEWPNMLKAFADAEIRDGFGELLHFLSDLGVPFIIITSGLAEAVRRVTAPWSPQIEAVYGAEVDASADTIRVSSPFPGERDLVAKERIIDHYQPLKAVVIGDSVSDFGMAKRGDLVFARHRLAEEMTRQGKAFHPYETFTVVKAVLRDEFSDLLEEGS